MSYQALIYQLDGAVARITFNRPDKLNAINETMMEELHGLLTEIAEDSNIQVVVIKGAGRAFSAGVDLKSTSESVSTGGSTFLKTGRAVTSLLESMPQVTIAQVHGYCFTGALEFMLAFDMAYCSHSTQMGDTHAKWGIVPGWGMSQRLARRVGLLRAKEMTYRALRVKGEEAERIGLVTRSVADEELENTIEQVIQDVTANSQSTLAIIKDLYNKGYNMTQGEGLDYENKINTETVMDDAGRIGNFGK